MSIASWKNIQLWLLKLNAPSLGPLLCWQNANCSRCWSINDEIQYLCCYKPNEDTKLYLKYLTSLYWWIATKLFESYKGHKIKKYTRQNSIQFFRFLRYCYLFFCILFYNNYIFFYYSSHTLVFSWPWSANTEITSPVTTDQHFFLSSYPGFPLRYRCNK